MEMSKRIERGGGGVGGGSLAFLNFLYSGWLVVKLGIVEGFSEQVFR